MPLFFTWKVILPLGTVARSMRIVLSVSLALTVVPLVAPAPHAARSRIEKVANARRVFIFPYLMPEHLPGGDGVSGNLMAVA